MTTFIKIVFLGSIALWSCHCQSGIQKETQQIIVSHKSFMRSLAFSGEINDKIYCENCKLNKYQIVVGLKNINPNTVSLSNQSFQPYYFFKNNNAELTITLSKRLYDFTEKGLLIEKKGNAEYLIIAGQSHIFMSDKQYKWLPD